jgi:Domain of unknown function (DUF4438), N-terminal/Domain of unknown function (DUF4438), C-terminal
MVGDARRIAPPPRRADAPRTNVESLVALAVSGQIANALVRGGAYRIGRDGVLRIVPGTGGIALNKRVGDRAVGLVADHVEPGVSVRNNDREAGGNPGASNRGLLLYSCIGNVARVVSGPASGAVGTVTGKHGGINNLLVDFPRHVIRRLRIGDRIQVAAVGQGLALPDYPGVRPMNLAPRLLVRWGVRGHGSHLHVPVTHIVPAGVMGSGLGKQEGVFGDTDIQLSDRDLRQRFRLHALRFGDLVAICGMDARFGASRRGGAITVGVVVHSDSNVAGHGPGVTPLLVSAAGGILPVYSPDANIASILGLRQRIAPAIPPGAEERSLVWRRAARPALAASATPSL